MKRIQGRGLLLMVLGGLALLMVILLVNTPPKKRAGLRPTVVPPANTSAPDISTNGHIKKAGVAVSAAEFTAEEKAALAKKFQEKFKPAVEKWCAAYAGHIPFRAEDVTLDKFHSALGKNYLYTFMIGDATLTIQEKQGEARVFYMAQGSLTKKLSTMPTTGTMPDISVPVTREEVIRMVKADTGIQYKPNECMIKPTGASGSLGGGAIVDIIPTGLDPDRNSSSKISFVFGPDGKLVNYLQ